MTRLGGWGIPGNGTLQSTTEKELLWGGDDAKGRALFMNAVYSGAMRDAANTPTTVCRPGLALGIVTASGEIEEWDADAVDGTQYFAGILPNELWLQDQFAENADRVFRNLVRGPVKSGQITIQGAAMIGHTDEYLLRRQMVEAGFIFDDDPMGYKAGQGSRFLSVAAATQLTAAQNGTLFLATGADVTFTLPAIKPGLEFEFTMLSDNEIVVASSEGDNMVVGNDASADKVTFTTAGQQIGARFRVKSVYVGTAEPGTLKWLTETPLVPFGTGTTGAFAYAITT